MLDEIKFRDDIDKPIGYISAVLKNMAENKKAEDEEKKRQAEPKSIEKIRIEIIKEFIPNRKVKRAEYIMDWQIKEKALSLLEQGMSEDEALKYWAKHGEEIAEKINELRKKAVTV